MKKPLTFVVRKAKDGFRWRLKSRNGKIIAESGEAYNRKDRLYSAITLVMSSDMKIKDTTK
jgi:uncharacterized protein YegP (UPF0339 family)